MSKNRDAWLIALDIDGTVLHEDGTLSPEVIIAVQKARDAGHEVTLATGRSVSMTIPILERLNIIPEYVVCSNGAITLKRDTGTPSGYRRFHVEIRQQLPNFRSWCAAWYNSRTVPNTSCNCSKRAL